MLLFKIFKYLLYWYKFFDN